MKARFDALSEPGDIAHIVLRKGHSSAGSFQVVAIPNHATAHGYLLKKGDAHLRIDIIGAIMFEQAQRI